MDKNIILIKNNKGHIIAMFVHGRQGIFVGIVNQDCKRIILHESLLVKKKKMKKKKW